MFATLLVSPTASVKYCRVHQRAWVESLDRWMAFREPTLYGSPVTEAVCDTCTASRHVAGCGESRRGCRHDWEYSHSIGFSGGQLSSYGEGSSASIMASATPSCFCTTQKHLAVKRSRSSMA